MIPELLYQDSSGEIAAQLCQLRITNLYSEYHDYEDCKYLCNTA